MISKPFRIKSVTYNSALMLLKINSKKKIFGIIQFLLISLPNLIKNI
jgi:hypothetical protein